MPGTHAILSPSSAERWLGCTPSAQFEQRFPDNSGAAADEGTLAHSLGELIIRFKLKYLTKSEYNKQLKELQASKYYDHAMHEHCENYAVFILEKYSEAKKQTSDALIFLEQKLDLTAYIPEGFGTSDAVIIADNVLIVNDLKYGKGVMVSSENNRQMMLYGLGAYCEYEMLYAIERVRMNIYQPRLDNVSTWEIPVSELLNWAETELRPKAQLAFDGYGEFVPGSHCRFCRAKARCKANAEFNLQIAKHDFADANMLEDADIAEILDKMSSFRTWLTGIEDYALSEALNNGKKWPGYKLVTGRSNRVYSDEQKVGTALLAAGHSEDLIYNKKLLGITALEKAIGKKAFGETVSPMLIKPPGKPTLAPLSDERPEFSTASSAATDFAEVSIDN